MEEITLYLNEAVYFKAGQKPITKYNRDHKIDTPWYDDVVETISVYKELHEVKIWYDNVVMEFHDVTWLKMENF